MPPADGPINQQPHAGHRQGHGENQDGELIVLHPQGAAADGGGQHRGQTPHGAQQQPLAPGQVRQPGEVAQQVLGGARHGEYQPEQGVPLGGALQEFQLLQLLPGEEDLHQLPAEPPHQGKHRHAAQNPPQQTQHAAPQGPEGIAAADLQGLPGDHSHHHLQKHHAHIGGHAQQAVAVHPQAELLRPGGKSHQGAANEPSHRRRQQQEDGDGRPGDELFLFIRENMLVHKKPRSVDMDIIPHSSDRF